MILNASHEITNCGLPLHVQERYVRYKQGNRAIVAWMTSYGPDKYKGRKTLPIKQMIALGRHLCDRLQDIGRLPPDVDYYFKDVIKERAYLSQHFRYYRDKSEQDDLETINHEHFTESLKQIHQILLTAGRPGQPKLAAPKDRNFFFSNSNSELPQFTQTSRFSVITSGYSDLLNDSDGEDSSSDGQTDATSAYSCASDDLIPESIFGNDHGSDFLDASGSLVQGVETIIFFNKIETISKTIQSVWSETGRLGKNIASSAAYTNVLMQQALRHTHDFLESEASFNSFHTVCQRVEKWFDDESNTHRGDVCQHSLLVLSKSLASVEQSLLSHRTQCNRHLDSVQEAEPQALIDRFFRDLSVLPQTCISSDLSFEWLQSFKTDGGAFSNIMERYRTCISFHIISLSHCAYSEALPKTTMIALPRISALKLANEALSIIRQFIDDKNIFPCQCTNTLGYRVTQMRNELERFAKLRCWNTLMQSPLVAGNHILDILDLCSYYGMHLFHYRHYVGSVIHTYNALVHLRIMGKVPSLDDLVELFTPVLFTTGKKPDSGFTASWLRYIGARLKFKTGRKHQNHKDTWCMSIPAHTAAKSAGLNINSRDESSQVQAKFDFGTIDLTMRLKRGGWSLNDEQQKQLNALLEAGEDTVSDLTVSNIDGQPTPSLVTSKNNKKARHKRTKSCIRDSFAKNCQSSPEPNLCSNLHHSILTNFAHDTLPECTTMPSSRFNLLALFHTMTKVVAGISDTTHAASESPATSTSTSSNTGKGQMCLCFTQTILRAADRILDTRRRSGLDAVGATLSKNERECVECFKSHLLKVLDDDGISGKGEDGRPSRGNWLWESVM